MKKAKVKLIKFSARLDDGSRKTIEENIICTCDSRGTAELIRNRIAIDYKVLTDVDGDNVPIYSLVVGY